MNLNHPLIQEHREKQRALLLAHKDDNDLNGAFARLHLIANCDLLQEWLDGEIARGTPIDTITIACSNYLTSAIAPLALRARDPVKTFSAIVSLTVKNFTAIVTGQVKAEGVRAHRDGRVEAVTAEGILKERYPR